MHSFWIYVNGQPAAATVTLTWAMNIAEAIAAHLGKAGGPITIRDSFGNEVYP